MSPPDTGAGPDWEALVTGESAAGMRLDRWLAGQLEGQLSRSQVRAMIEAGEVLCDGEAATPALRLRAGQRVEWRRQKAVPELPEPEPLPLAILHEDEHLIVVDKAAGMVVHPGAGFRSGTLVNALMHHCRGRLSRLGGADRPGIVHRIDKDTSGILVAAKTDEAHRGLAAAFADHGRTGGLDRIYLVLAWGCPDPARGTIDAALGRAPDRVRRSVVPEDRPDARPALTRYETLECYGRRQASLLQCRLETGRTHQIRVHLAHIGHPVIGDPAYGRGFATKARTLPEPARSMAQRIPRQALHAARLGFIHPVTGAPMRFDSPLPPDMAALAEALRNI
jgi:23S rRNA pseudouridine1911/1915/1917 synthase